MTCEKRCQNQGACGRVGCRLHQRVLALVGQLARPWHSVMQDLEVYGRDRHHDICWLSAWLSVATDASTTWLLLTYV